MHTQTKSEAAEALIAADQSENIERGEIVRATAAPASSPTSIRFSAPLLEALDGIARVEHRTRGNLVQHVLWEYVRSRKPLK